MNYNITLIVSLIIMCISTVSFYIYRSAYEKQSRLMLSGVIKRIKIPKLRVVRNRFLVFSLVIIASFFIIDTTFIPLNRCSDDNVGKSVEQWEQRLNRDPSYAMCFCDKGYPVFKDPNAAFLRLFIDNPDGIIHLIGYYHVPLTRLNFEMFLNYQNAGQYYTSNPNVIKQIDRIKFILGIYNNSFSKHRIT